MSGGTLEEVLVQVYGDRRRIVAVCEGVVLDRLDEHAIFLLHCGHLRAVELRQNLEPQLLLLGQARLHHLPLLLLPPPLLLLRDLALHLLALLPLVAGQDSLQGPAPGVLGVVVVVLRADHGVLGDGLRNLARFGGRGHLRHLIISLLRRPVGPRRRDVRRRRLLGLLRRDAGASERLGVPPDVLLGQVLQLLASEHVGRGAAADSSWRSRLGPGT
mmetsp:Transcript_119953/g.373576  ORF Transcript_119953/g.373576 Transcript_119953/m.373576 type:complete len:216 (+) Transcript_119953:311-958(+)